MSLNTQKFKDFEVRIYHDGELNRPLSLTSSNIIKELKATFSIEPYLGMWGHNNRDKGIWEAQGEYIIHLNSDNVLYDLQEIADYITETEKRQIYIFPVKMMGVIVHDNKMIRTRNVNDAIILNGMPKKYNIDCMQLIARTETWRQNGGWYDCKEESDGEIYEAMCKINPYTKSKILLGEHW